MLRAKSNSLLLQFGLTWLGVLLLGSLLAGSIDVILQPKGLFPNLVVSFSTAYIVMLLLEHKFIFGSSGSADGREQTSDAAFDSSLLTNAYMTLGVSPGCSGAELRQAYHGKLAELQPDRHVDNTMEQVIRSRKVADLNFAFGLIRRSQ